MGACWAARATQTALEGAVVPTARTWRTPASAARCSTSGRSSRNLSSSRWAWVSNSSGITSGNRGLDRGLGGGQALQCLEVPPLHLDELLHPGGRLGVDQTT